MTNSRDAEPRGSRKKGPSYGLAPRIHSLTGTDSFLDKDFSGIQSTDELLASLTARLGRSDSLNGLPLDEIDRYSDAFIAGMQIYYWMAIFEDMAEGNLSETSRSFMGNYETAAAHTAAWLASLERGDLKAYLTFENKFTNPAFGGLEKKDIERIVATPNSSISADIDAASAGVASLNGKTDLASIQNAVVGRAIERVKQTLAPVQSEDSRTWDRLSTAWETQQVFDALDLIPDLAGIVHESTIAALEDNLLSGQVRFSPADYESLNVEGIKSLFAFRWNDTDLLDRIPHRYQNLQEAVREEDIATDNLMLRELGPSAAIELIWNVLKDTDPTNRSAALIRIHDAISENEDYHNVWLLALLTLRHRDQSMIEVKELVRSWAAIPANVRTTILDEIPGNVFLTPEGKIVARPTTLKKGIRLYESTAGREEQDDDDGTDDKNEEGSGETVIFEKVPEPLCVESGQREISKRFIPSADVYEPFTQDLINRIASSKVAANKDWGALADERSRLQTEFDYGQQRQKDVLFYSAHHPQNPWMRRAKGIGIDAVRFYHDNVIFVVDRDTAYTTVRDEAIAVAFSGTLDRKGELTVHHVDEAFILDPAYLELNNIALGLANERVRDIKDLSDNKQERMKHYKELKVEAYRAADGWNNTGRHKTDQALPRLSLDGWGTPVTMPIPKYNTSVVLRAEE